MSSGAFTPVQDPQLNADKPTVHRTEIAFGTVMVIAAVGTDDGLLIARETCGGQVQLGCAPLFSGGISCIRFLLRSYGLRQLWSSPSRLSWRALAGVAYATIPDSGGVIHGCYLKAVGSLRVIDPGAGQHCTKAETPISWNQTGPQGPTGPTGPAGPQGPQGASAPQQVFNSDYGPMAYLNEEFNAITTLQLPYNAGRLYALTVTGELGGTVGNTVSCYLYGGIVGSDPTRTRSPLAGRCPSTSRSIRNLLQAHLPAQPRASRCTA